MGIFFKKVERKESVKSVAIIKKVLLILLIISCVMAIFSGAVSSFIKVVLVLASILSIIDGVESYIHKEEGRVYRVDFSFAALYLFIMIFI